MTAQAHPAPSQCPHCRGVAHTRSNSELRQTCNICGAPRVVLQTSHFELSGQEAPLLQAAQKARGSRLGWRIGGAISLLGTAFFLGSTLLAALIGAGASWVVTGLAMSLPFILLAATAAGKSKARGRELANHIESAWRTAARDVVMQSANGISAEQLAQVLAITPAAAEQILTELTIDQQLHSHITDEGQLLFTPALRIDSAAAIQAPQAALPPGLDAELEALAAQHALAEQPAAHLKK